MIGIGTDLVELDRFRLALQRTPGLVDRLFSEAEQAYARRRKDPTERYAARFAAKEAVMKAMGVGLWKFPLKDIEVVKAPSGAPSVRLHGKAARLAEERGVREWRLTLTHTDRVAQAIAVAL
jgi:holo-[acyl-carrier protein] synthase